MESTKMGRNKCPFQLFFADVMLGKSPFRQKFGFQAVLKQSSFQLCKKSDFTRGSFHSLLRAKLSTGLVECPDVLCLQTACAWVQPQQNLRESVRFGLMITLNTSS